MLDYKKSLNSAQYEAVTCQDRSVLVVAGAGTGKTRTIVYRLAWLVEQGVMPGSILLLTFTRKAAREMQARAAHLIGQGLEEISGGTFHAFAFAALRHFSPPWLEGRPFTLMDSADVAQALRNCRDKLKIAKKDSSFPKMPTVAAIISKSRNKELPIGEILRQESCHLLPHADAINDMAVAYAEFRRQHGLLDYDDLLSELHDLLGRNDYAADYLRNKFSHILVDEYQDTNLVQARIVRSLASAPQGGAGAQVMAVGDEAQSIYAFRGANVRNILDFPSLFPETRIIRLEENYRSTQPILDVANDILANAPESFHKKLFTKKASGEPVRLVTPLSDTSEAGLVVQRIEELLATHLPHEIAVLFRAGYHSYPLENALRKAGISFRKYGGLRFIEAAHVKDVLSFARLSLNPLDLPAFSRIAAMHKGIGPKTVARLYDALRKNDPARITQVFAKYAELRADLEFTQNTHAGSPALFMERLLEYYRPRLETLYPEDWPARLPGLEELLQMAAGYDSLDLFVADLALETPEEDGAPDKENHITLSTVHSAKGLEWNAVLLIDLVEDRFPSRHALARPEDLEEERRLFYVACTRARQTLDLYAPATVFSRGDHAAAPVAQSPFLRELPRGSLQTYTEKFGGALSAAPGGAPGRMARGSAFAPENNDESAPLKARKPEQLGYCRHRIFGRGKIIKKIDSEKMQVNFPGFGLKIILSDYLLPED